MLSEGDRPSKALAACNVALAQSHSAGTGSAAASSAVGEEGAPLAARGAQPDVTPVPLRAVVASLLIDWGVASDDSEEESDDFCGWHVGSRVEGQATCHASAPSEALINGLPQGSGLQGSQKSCNIL